MASAVAGSGGGGGGGGGAPRASFGEGRFQERSKETDVFVAAGGRPN